MDSLEVLIQTRALIEDQSRWTQKTRARDRWGQAVPACDQAAVKWCALGAMARITENDFNLHLEAYNRVRPFLGGHSLWYVNDYAGHEELLARLDRAIAAHPAWYQREPELVVAD